MASSFENPTAALFAATCATVAENSSPTRRLLPTLIRNKEGSRIDSVDL
jgi:hypothetical protein